MIKPLPLKCLLLAFSFFLQLPNSAAQSLGDYQTNGNVTFDNAQNWQQYNGSAWVPATAAPDFSNETITIRNGHTASVTTNVTLDQLVIESGGTFWLNTSGVTFTLNDDPGDDADLEIKTGGRYIHGSPGNVSWSFQIPSGDGTIQIRKGGLIRIDHAGSGQGDWYANNENIFEDRMKWETDAVFEWHTNSPFNTLGIIYFPNAADEIPVFRLSSPVANIGANTSTTINGVFEANVNVSWFAAGTKTFRNGIRGTGTVTQSSNCGAFLISGPTAELNGTGNLELNTGGMKISAATLQCAIEKTITTVGSNTVNVNLEGGNGQQIGGSGTLTFGLGITLDVKNDVSLLGPLVANGSIQLSGGSITLHTHNLTAGSISGYNNTKYIITNGEKNATSGFLIQDTSGGRVFPIGTGTGPNHYTPAFVSGSVPYQVRVFNQVYENGNGNTEISEKDQVVQKTWHILPESGNPTAQVQLQWNSSNEGKFFQTTRASNPQSLVITAAPVGGPWANLLSDDMSGTDPFTLNATGAVSSSDFVYFTAYDNPFVPLPVTLLSFREQREGRNVRLEWSTASENKNAGFEVQRSANLQEFVSVGFVAANTSYQAARYYTFTDKNQPEAAYYRLKQVDHNGDFEYCKPIFVNENSAFIVNSLMVYPNPTQDEIHLSLPEDVEAHFRLTNPLGISLQNFSALPVAAEIRLSQTLAHLPTGIYLLHTTQAGQHYFSRIVKR